MNGKKKMSLLKKIIKLPWFWYKAHSFNTATPDTIPALKDAIRRTKNLSGDYYEFGVYKGYSLAKAYDFAKKFEITNMKFYGFDSFEGLPEVEDIDRGDKFSKGNYSCSLEKVSKNLGKRMKSGKITLIKGFYSESLKKKNPVNSYNLARVVLVDCDLYSSTVSVLNFIKDKLQTGTVILFDDWNCFNASDERGERRATKEFLEKTPEIKLKHIADFGWHGSYFEVEKIIKRTD